MTLSLHRRRGPRRSARPAHGVLHTLAAADDDPVLLCGADADCDCNARAGLVG